MAGKIQKNPYASQDKYLIAEQSGTAVLISGFLVALFIGLLVRAAISPNRVKSLIEKAAQSIHNDVQVTFHDAEVSLSDGILPRFAVVISDVVMSSSQECWMQPHLTVDQIRMPISIYGLITGQGVLRQVQADTVKVQLAGEYKNCGGQLNPPSETESSNTEPARLVSLQSNIADSSRGRYSNRIQSVTIERLQVSADKYPNYLIDLHDLGFDVKNYEPRWLVLNSKTQLFHDGQVGDYLSHANIHLEYKESPEPVLQAHFFGNWREGYYSVVGKYQLLDKSFILETELKHIPFSQILSLMQRYSLADPALNARQLWLSFHSRFAGDVNHFKEAPFEITNLLVDGDQIEIDSDRILFRSLVPLKYDPIQLNIQKVGVDKILNFFNRSIPTRIFANMGAFTGSAEIYSGQDIRLQGHHVGLEFIFSNKGQRELQTIKKMRTTAEFKNENWKIQLSDVEPDQGTFDGNISLNANKSFSDMKLKMKAEKALFSPAVQKLMTQGGGVGPISSAVDFSTKDRRISDIKGFLKVDTMKVEGIEMTGTQIRLNYLKNEMQLDTKVAVLRMSADSYPMKIIGEVFSSVTKNVPEGLLQVSNISGQFQINESKTFRWKSMTGTLAKNGRVQTEGSWDEQGQLNGSVLVKLYGQEKWQIGGTRGAPEFSPGHESLRK